jgi:hypothetical protein
MLGIAVSKKKKETTVDATVTGDKRNGARLDVEITHKRGNNNIPVTNWPFPFPIIFAFTKYQ